MTEQDPNMVMFADPDNVFSSTHCNEEEEPRLTNSTCKQDAGAISAAGNKSSNVKDCRKNEEENPKKIFSNNVTREDSNELSDQCSETNGTSNQDKGAMSAKPKSIFESNSDTSQGESNELSDQLSDIDRAISVGSKNIFETESNTTQEESNELSAEPKNIHKSKTNQEDTNEHYDIIAETEIPSPDTRNQEPGIQISDIDKAMFSDPNFPKNILDTNTTEDKSEIPSPATLNQSLGVQTCGTCISCSSIRLGNTDNHSNMDNEGQKYSDKAVDRPHEDRIDYKKNSNFDNEEEECSEKPKDQTVRADYNSNMDNEVNECSDKAEYLNVADDLPAEDKPPCNTKYKYTNLIQAIGSIANINPSNMDNKIDECSDKAEDLNVASNMPADRQPGPSNTMYNNFMEAIGNNTNDKKIVAEIGVKGYLNPLKELHAEFSKHYQSVNASSNENNPFLCLPEEILIKIFSYLAISDLCTSVAPVCRKFRYLAADHTLWRSLDFSSHMDLDSLNFLWVIRRAPLLRRLIVRGRSKLSEVEVAIVSESCPELREFDFGFCDNLSSAMLRSLPWNCCNLVSINVEGCQQVDDKCLMVFAKCGKLTHLNLSHCVYVQDNGLTYLAKNMTRIVDINLDGVRFITDRGLKDLTTCHQEHLEELELDGAEITDIGISLIAQCRRLKHLGISFCECLTDDSLEYIKACKELEYLRLRKGSDFTSDGLIKFFTETKLTKLRNLNMSECIGINDDVVLPMVMMCGKTLRELALSWCWFITDRGLISIVDHCGLLESLDVLGIDKIHGECITRVPEEMPYLTFLDCRQCNNFKDDVIYNVIRRKPDLKVIDYYGQEFVHLNQST